MTILISSLAGGGSAKKISSIEIGNTIASGTTADVTIACPVDKYINLTFLMADGAGSQSGVTLTVGGRTILSSKGITGENQSSTGVTLKIGRAGTTSDSQTNTQLTGGRNEDFVFSFGAATTDIIYYVYEVLEDA